mmetsp:Transcript_50711/g.91021  ORF Transcript_50711/g.91021 Transcript_50711/m.91021 type:complete len:150 (-) Transcript_50711:203-652(-)
MGNILTSCTVSGFCAGLTLLAGIAHAVQGIRDPAGCKELNLPQWFMTCAGLWMTGSGALWFYDKYIGFLFMASSMGGAAAAAASSYRPIGEPGIFLSTAVLAAMAYATPSLPLTDKKYAASCFSMWIFGIMAVYFLAKPKTGPRWAKRG